MRRAEPHELNAKVVPVLAATLSKKDLQRLFPVRFDEVDSFSEPEPSEGALVQLESGPLAVVMWGRSTGNLTVSLPEAADRPKVIRALLSEVSFPLKAITWRADQATPTRARVTVMTPKKRARPRPHPLKKAAKMPARKTARGHRHAPRRKR
jgi:hypothetical protein